MAQSIVAPEMAELDAQVDLVVALNKADLPDGALLRRLACRVAHCRLFGASSACLPDKSSSASGGTCSRSVVFGSRKGRSGGRCLSKAPAPVSKPCACPLKTTSEFEAGGRALRTQPA